MADYFDKWVASIARPRLDATTTARLGEFQSRLARAELIDMVDQRPYFAAWGIKAGDGLPCLGGFPVGAGTCAANAA